LRRFARSAIVTRAPDRVYLGESRRGGVRAGSVDRVTAVPLRRNRDFVLLQSGQLLSNLGTQLTVIAYPLLVLALTGSAAKAGIVGFARFLPRALLAVPAGMIADRWNRKWLMVGSDAVRVVATGLLALLIVFEAGGFWWIPAIAFVDGAAGAFFGAAYPGAIRSVVAVPQLPDAMAVQTGRGAVVQLAGAPIGGALFTVARALPFVVDVLSYSFSLVSVALMRTPFQGAREPETTSLRARMIEAVRYMWHQPFLRTSALIFGPLNFVAFSLLFSLVVIGHDQGLGGGAIGLLLSAFFGVALIGTFLARHVRAALPPWGVLVLELWTWTCCVAFVVWPNVYVLAVSILPSALAMPSTDSVVHGYRMAMTPERLLGRMEAVWSTFAVLMATFAPLVMGYVIEEVSARAAVGICAGLAVALAVWGTTSGPIRHAPVVDELADLPVTPAAAL
jgi:MFS family permease